MIIGENVVVEEGVCIARTTILSGAHIKSHSWIQNSIIGWKSTIGKWVSQSVGILYIYNSLNR